MTPSSLDGFTTKQVFHKTWAGTFYCKPQAIFQPTNLDQIKELIKQARLNKKTIMTVGSGHSPSDLTMTTEWLCNLDKFNSVLKQEEFYGPSESGTEVKYVDLTVEAGIRIYELNTYLKQHKLAIQNLGSISDQLIAGLISTGTHGSTQYHGLVSQQVVSLQILNSEGKLVTCSSIENAHIFRAAMLSLGKIGIITQVTIRTCPQYTIKSLQEIIPFEQLLNEWDSLWLQSEFIRIWWYPYTGNCILWRASKSEEPLSEPRYSWFLTRFGRLFYESLLWVAVHVVPSLTPGIERFIFKQQYGGVTSGGGDIAVQNSVEGLNLDCLFSQFVNEWSAPLNGGVKVLTDLRDTLEQAAKSGAFYSHAPIEVRCANVTYSEKPFEVDGVASLHPPQEWLSKRTKTSPGPIPGNNLRPYLDNSPDTEYSEGPVTNDQLTLFINATMYRPFGTNVETHQWFQIFENILFEAGGKPHWAKNFIGVESKGDSTKDDFALQARFGGKPFYAMIGFKPLMENWFGKRLIDWNEVRRGMDPEGVFLSGKAWLDRNGVLL